MFKNEPSQVDQTCKIFLASGSKFFLQGLQKILENESDMEISGETSNPDEVKRHIVQIKPNFLFLDNRILDLNIHNLLNLITEKSPKTRLILFRPHSKDEVDFPNIIYLTEETNCSELIQIMRGERKLTEHSVETDNATKLNLTIMESRVIKLIANGFTNEEVASKLLIKEKTVKAHLTHIFIKLNFQNRYQLMIYANKVKRRVQ